MNWKSLLAVAAVAVFAGAVCTGCGGDSAGGSGDKGKKEVPVIGGPAAPKDADLIYKLGDKDVPLYMYTGELPKDIHADISTASICK